MNKTKKVSDSETVQTYLLMPADMNPSGALYGGKLMEWVDMMAGIVGMRHCDSRVVTAAVDSLVFKEGAYASDVLTLVGKVTWVGNSSFEVRVDTWRENKGGVRHPVNTAFLVMVCMDDEGHPKPAPKLLLETDEQREAFALGEMHAAQRKANRS